MMSIMQEWRTGLIGTGGILASITVKQWSDIAAAIGATLTAIYVGWKLWDEKIKPWLESRK